MVSKTYRSAVCLFGNGNCSSSSSVKNLCNKHYHRFYHLQVKVKNQTVLNTTELKEFNELKQIREDFDILNGLPKSRRPYVKKSVEEYEPHEAYEEDLPLCLEDYDEDLIYSYGEIIKEFIQKKALQKKSPTK